MCDAIVSVAMRDMDKGSRGISHAEFDAWLASDGGSSTAVRLLLQTLGTAIAGPAGAQTSIFSPFCFFCLGVIVDRLPFFLSHCDPLISLLNERGLPCYLVVQRDKSLPFYLVVESQCEEAPFFLSCQFFCWWRFLECLIGDVCLIEAPHPPAAICAYIGTLALFFLCAFFLCAFFFMRDMRIGTPALCFPPVLCSLAPHTRTRTKRCTRMGTHTHMFVRVYAYLCAHKP